MEKKNQNFLFTLRTLLTILLFLVLILGLVYQLSFYKPECYACKRTIPLSLILVVLAIVIFLIIVAISLKLHDLMSSYMGVVTPFFIILLVFLFASDSLFPGCLGPRICDFNTTQPGAIGCVSYNLQKQTSQLSLGLATTEDQIVVNGIRCIKSDALHNISSTPDHIEPLSQPIKINRSTVVDGVPSVTVTTLCTNEDGSMPSDTSEGTPACLHVYINYTETATGESYVAPGEIWVRYY